MGSGWMLCCSRNRGAHKSFCSISSSYWSRRFARLHVWMHRRSSNNKITHTITIKMPSIDRKMCNNRILISRRCNSNNNSNRWFRSFTQSNHRDAELMKRAFVQRLAEAFYWFCGSLHFRCFSNNHEALCQSHRTRTMWTMTVATRTVTYRPMAVSSKHVDLWKIWVRKRSKHKSYKVSHSPDTNDERNRRRQA